jgi:hypothetical protein
MMNSTPLSVCNLEEMIQLAPWAVVYLFRASLGLFVTTLRWTSSCSAKTILCVAVDLAGLTVLDRHQTRSRIVRTIGQSSPDALNRLAEHLRPLSDQLVIGLLLLLESLTPGYLILDDVFVPKPFAHYGAGADPGYDHAQKRHLVGHRLVALIWTNGVVCVPVAFVFWPHRHFVRTDRTKNQLARLLVYWAIRHHSPCPYLTCDNWYASKQNLRFFDGIGLIVVTKLRHNAWITYEQTAHRVSWLRRFEAHHYADLDAYVRQFSVEYPGYGPGRLALVKHDKHAEPGRTKYLFTNAPTLTVREVGQRYRSRWAIECFFRTCKQSFGLGACQAQMMPQVLFHVRMVFLAYTLTQLLISEPTLPMEQMQTHLRSLACLTLPNRPAQLVIKQPDGPFLPIALETLLAPLRTRLPSLQTLPIPTLMELKNSE